MDIVQTTVAHLQTVAVWTAVYMMVGQVLENWILQCCITTVIAQEVFPGTFRDLGNSLLDLVLRVNYLTSRFALHALQCLCGARRPHSALLWERGRSSFRESLFMLALFFSQLPSQGVARLLMRSVVWLLVIQCLLWLLASLFCEEEAEEEEAAEDREWMELFAYLQRCVLPYFVCTFTITLFDCSYSLGQGWACGLLLYSVCSDGRLLRFFKTQGRRIHVDCLDGLEGELVHAVLLLVKLALCVAAFVWTDNLSVMALLFLTGCIFLCLDDLYDEVYVQIRTVRAFLSMVLPRATRAELEEYGDVCAVCLCPMRSARVTCCRHLFHGKCLRQVISVNTLCPLCKTDLLSD